MFRDAKGHVPDTALNRALLQRTAADPKNLKSTQPAGDGSQGNVQTYQQTLPNGTQVWVEVYNGQITNGGINAVPRKQ
jgi:hypothetical protein